MPISLPKELRNQFSREACRTRQSRSLGKAALENLAVHESDYRSHMTVDVRQLRNRLRARGRVWGIKKMMQREHRKSGALLNLWHTKTASITFYAVLNGK